MVISGTDQVAVAAAAVQTVSLLSECSGAVPGEDRCTKAPSRALSPSGRFLEVGGLRGPRKLLVKCFSPSVNQYFPGFSTEDVVDCMESVAGDEVAVQTSSGPIRPADSPLTTTTTYPFAFSRWDCSCGFGGFRILSAFQITAAF
ncbi:hypothetical protein C8R44DRAFT_745424 [Mycena epipterygia]|nr:hypothetical protein C8R44DRAFT_745424 [Mycena epipterygia]